jgi:hypothetical protein
LALYLRFVVHHPIVAKVGEPLATPDMASSDVIAQKIGAKLEKPEGFRAKAPRAQP